jgi:hypothetical protein
MSLGPHDLSRPRSAGALCVSALALLRARPWLFLALAFAVVAPYELIVLAATGTAPLAESSTKPATALTLTVIEFAFVGPLISALQARAVADVGRGGRPTISEIVRGSAAVLPVAAAAQIVAGIAIGIGFVFFVIPGLYFAVRFAVVAQVAAVERTDWIDALRRSGELVRGSFWHALGLLFLLGMLSYVVTLAAGAASGTATNAGTVIFGIVVLTLVRSFTALATAVLYFELLGRAAS